jgi:hypothetical protein
MSEFVEDQFIYNCDDYKVSFEVKYGFEVTDSGYANMFIEVYFKGVDIAGLLFKLNKEIYWGIAREAEQRCEKDYEDYLDDQKYVDRDIVMDNKKGGKKC